MYSFVGGLEEFMDDFCPASKFFGTRVGTPTSENGEGEESENSQMKDGRRRTSEMVEYRNGGRRPLFT